MMVEQRYPETITQLIINYADARHLSSLYWSRKDGTLAQQKAHIAKSDRYTNEADRIRDMIEADCMELGINFKDVMQDAELVCKKLKERLR